MPDDNIAPAPVAPAPAPDAAAGRMRRIKDALLCLSLANLLFMNAWFGVLFEEDHGYFNQIPVTSITLAGLLLNIGGWAFGFWLLSGLVRRGWGGRAVQALADVSLCLLLLVPANFARLQYFDLAGTQVVALAKEPLALALGVGLAAVLLRWHRLWARGARLVVAVFLPLVAFTLAHLLWNWLRLEPPAPPAALLPFQSGAATNQPRVLWIIFDELDRRLLFDERPAGHVFEEFDRLRAVSLDATNSFPPSGNTVLSIPALTTGRPIISSVPVSASDLDLVWQDSREHARWSAASNVFARASELGLNSGIAGWYHPYGRVLANSANRIDWVPTPVAEQARAATFAGTMFNQIGTMVPFLHVRRLAVQRVSDLLTRARALALDTNIHLAFLHLPPPHKPGICRQHTGEFTPFNFGTSRGYFANVQLADRWLGETRHALARLGLEDRTWLLVSSDH